MFNFLLSAESAESAQGGIPTVVWIIVGIILAIVAIVLAIKSFWVSKGIAIVGSIAGVVFSIVTMTNADDPDFLLVGALVSGAIMFITYVFLLGNAVFDSETEGDYLIAGTLVHDTNHPFKAFCGYCGGIAALTFFIFWAAYAWTFVIGLVAFILTLLLAVGMIIERVRG